MEKDYLQEALGTFNTDKSQWYGWKKDFTGDKRMSYENIILNDKTATMPTKAKVDAKIKELKEQETAKANAKISGKKKLKDLGLDDDEISALIGE